MEINLHLHLNGLETGRCWYVSLFEVEEIKRAIRVVIALPLGPAAAGSSSHSSAKDGYQQKARKADTASKPKLLATVASTTASNNNNNNNNNNNGNITVWTQESTNRNEWIKLHKK